MLRDAQCETRVFALLARARAGRGLQFLFSSPSYLNVHAFRPHVTCRLQRRFFIVLSVSQENEAFWMRWIHKHNVLQPAGLRLRISRAFRCEGALMPMRLALPRAASRRHSALGCRARCPETMPVGCLGEAWAESCLIFANMRFQPSTPFSAVPHGSRLTPPCLFGAGRRFNGVD